MNVFLIPFGRKEIFFRKEFSFLPDEKTELKAIYNPIIPIKYIIFVGTDKIRINNSKLKDEYRENNRSRDRSW